MAALLFHVARFSTFTAKALHFLITVMYVRVLPVATSLEVGKGVELIFRHPKLVSGHVHPDSGLFRSIALAEQC